MSNGNSFSDQPKAAAPWLLDVIRWPRLPGQAARGLAAGLLAMGALAGGVAAAAHTTPARHPVAVKTCAKWNTHGQCIFYDA